MSLNNKTIRTSIINDTLNPYHKRNHLSYTHTHTHTHTTATPLSMCLYCPCTQRETVFFVSLFGAVISKCYCCFDWFPKSGPLQCCQMWVQTTNLPSDWALLLRGWVLCQTSLPVRLDLYRILTEVMRKIFEGIVNISIIHIFLFIAMTLHFDFILGLLCSH